MNGPVSEAERIVERARYVLAMLERLSADSIYAHRASGLRGSILRCLDEPGQPDTYRLEALLEAGFAILEKAAGLMRGSEDETLSGGSQAVEQGR
jgi:hypothetical protein